MLISASAGPGAQMSLTEPVIVRSRTITQVSADCRFLGGSAQRTLGLGAQRII
jgi:hypothetical protein